MTHNDPGTIEMSDDTRSLHSGVEMSTEVVRCDVAVVGAGQTGINALYVASRYLSGNQKLVLIDSRKRGGGMWHDAYSYVRLHQPHRLFTAGDIKWTLDRARSYLATGNEVLDHLEHCLDVIRKQVRLEEFFGWTFDTYEEVDGIVRVRCSSEDGRHLVIETKRLIKAYGHRIVPNDALTVSSKRVRSVSPNFCDMRGAAMRASDAPVWVIGGGKTGMDTAHTLITNYPEREVNLVAGSGTWFLSRERCFPAGARRWWSGTPISNIVRETALRFDGTNETDVDTWMRTRYGTWLTPHASNFRFAFLSEFENDRIAAGLNQVVMDYVVDAVDRDGATELVFRSGATKPIASDSWIVNCTGYLLDDRHPYEPYLSPSGAVLSIHTRSATFTFQSYMAYFMTHLLFLDKVGDIPLYELDMVDLAKKSTAAFHPTAISLSHYNAGLVADCVPARVLLDFGLDQDRWYPLPRRATNIARYALGRHRIHRDHHRRTLDTVRDRFDVRCGPLETLSGGR
ncbi:potassium transporter [Nocardia sp. 2YAB30]|uniref:potassium transporter n=1 Tax=unclassified Nocardia TaxID=2637762 RepID=UPI003F98B843